MDSDGANHRRSQSNRQAIPLQDLSDPEHSNNGLNEPSHRRTLSDRGRDLFQRSRHSLLQRDEHGVRYAPVGTTDTRASGRSPSRVGLGLNLDTGLRARHPSSASDDATTAFSPVGPGFQEAMGFTGLSFNAVESPVRDQQTSPGRRARIADLPTLRTIPPDDDELEETRSLVPLPDEEFGDGTGAFPSENDADTAPLTGSSHRGSSQPSTPMGQRHDRFSPRFRHNRFLSAGQASPAMLDPEPGHSSSGRPRRYSNRLHTPTSPLEAPLRRAGTVMQRMSNRVVNLSNEPVVIGESIDKKSRPSEDVSTSQRPSFEVTSPQHDGPSSPHAPTPEKAAPTARETSFPDLPARPTMPREDNPLRGKSLGIFGPENRLRKILLQLLTNPFVEPFILVLIFLQTILLAFDASKNVFTHPRSLVFGKSWIDYAMLALFSVYTLEISAKVIVSGFIINPVEYSTIDRQVSFRRAVLAKAQNLFSVHRKPSVAQQHGNNAAVPHQTLIRSFTAQMPIDGQDSKRQAAKKFMSRRAHMRHSFNRIDFLAVCAYWIALIISITGMQANKHVFVFRMLSCLRILRLLYITGGTAVILRSLKRAMPILLNVAFLICFFWLLFAIIGMQSFKSSLRRTCVWKDPDTANPNRWPDFAQNTSGSFQFCGGWKRADGQEMPYLRSDGVTLATDQRPKGYLCPVNSYCIEGRNPYNGTVSFDNLPQSMELVFVIMTTNTWSDIMYYLTDSDYLIVALFFAFGIVILTLWMVNLLIAVITSSFQIIREESRESAFAAEHRDTQPPTPDEDEMVKPRRENALSRFLHKIRLLWIGVILFGLVAQAFRSATMGENRAKFIIGAEIAVTFVLDLEIILRFIANIRTFFRSRQNMFDLFLAIVTSVIQIPLIRNSYTAYAWLSVFQILRTYRIVLSVPFLRELIFVVLGNFSGLANLILFVFLLTFLACLFATQLLRGQLPMQDSNGNELVVSFFSIWNAFLGMYQMLSSENWTTILYNVTAYQVNYNTGWIGAAFCILWYILANFVVLNMFIAVIQENFDVSEDEKRLQQVKSFLSQKRFLGASTGVLSLSSLFKFGNARKQDPLDFGSAATEMLLKDAVVSDFLDEATDTPQQGPVPARASTFETMKNLPSIPGAPLLQRIKNRLFRSEPNPFYSNLQLSSALEDGDPRAMAKEVVQATEQRKVAQREYLRKHPDYNNSLFFFKPGNPVRRFCQNIVGPGRGGDRVQGPMPSVPVWYAFSAFTYAAIVAMVLLACVTTPLYQKQYFAKHGFSARNWFVWTDVGFAALFTVEAIIKVIADGFLWTPNAYFRSSWGLIDGIVLITLWVNVIAFLYDPGGGSRTVGAFKALRALRLLNVSDNARNTFHAVIVMGGWKVLSAAFVSMSLLIPFAIYGLNLFNGQMQSCNDTQSGIINLTDCVGEYMSSPFEWNVLAPRHVGNSYYSFDDFRHSLFILFQIVSQEGWIDVMFSGQSITGVFKQPTAFASQGNAVFFVVFNLLGAVFVLTLFVSVFMRNYTELTGVAFLTTEQRSWLELRKLLRQVSPSKRPNTKKRRESWQEWCYKRAIKKTGKWHRMITALLILHLVLLCLEWYPDNSNWLHIRDFIFFAMILVYVANVIVRIIGLSWQRFRKSAWDLYSVLSVFGTFITSILVFSQPLKREFVQMHKLFLVSIALLLIPRNNQLDQLFKTAAASLSSIGNLLATWFVLFLVFAIALNQTFGLTRFGDNENDNVNFRTVPKTLILLFRTSTGEGWNQLMNDFATIVPPYCTVGQRYFDGDCGSAGWAESLFILWNILSMYIFINLFVSLIYESFSYVYQRSSGLSVISREEIRRFKQAWSEHDPEGTGYITKAAFPRLLGELSGVFEMRIYDGDYTVKSILEACLLNKNRMTAASMDSLFHTGTATMLPTGNEGFGPRKVLYPDVDLELLNERLADLPVEEIRKRRARMNTFYEEVLVSADPDKGIEFSSLLMILAHYKVINDNRSLRLEEFLRRRARLQRVEEAVRRHIVVGFFDTLYWSRKFRRRIESRKHARMTAVPTHDFEVPEIYVQDESAAPQVLDNTGATPTTPIIRVDGANWDGATPPAPSSTQDSPSWSADSAGRQRSLRSTPGSDTPSRRPRANSNLSPGASPTPARSGGAPYPLDPGEVDDRGSWFLTSALTEPFDSFGPDPYAGPLELFPSATEHSRSGSTGAASFSSSSAAGNLAPPRPSLSVGGSAAATPVRATATGSRASPASTSSTGRARAATTVSHRDMMDELDNSAWGESIRRSFTVRRPEAHRSNSHGHGHDRDEGRSSTSTRGGGGGGGSTSGPSGWRHGSHGGGGPAAGGPYERLD